MFSFNNLFEPMLTDEILASAFISSAKGKLGHKRVQKVLNSIEQHLIILKHKLRNNTWKPRIHDAVSINEHSCMKERTIIKPDYKYEQIVHHAVIKELQPCVMKGMYHYTCGSIPGRGVHYGKKYITKILKDVKNTAYVAKLDITHFFQSINQRKLLRWLRKKIRDNRFFNLLELIISCVKKGIPLGFYTSQWFANFLLQPLDHFIKEVLHVKYFIRYMDDMVMFFRTKADAHKAVEAVRNFLSNHFDLRLKYNEQVFKMYGTKKVMRTNPVHFKVAEKMLKKLDTIGVKAKMKGHKNKTYLEFNYGNYQYYKTKILKILVMFNVKLKQANVVCGRKLDFMGFLFTRFNITMRKSILFRSIRKVNKVSKKDKITWHDASVILSYLGWYKHADVYDVFLNMIKPFITVKKLRRLLSRHSRKRRKISMTDWRVVEGTQLDKPLELDTTSSSTTVYQRRNIHQVTKTRTVNDTLTGKEKEEEYQVWEYEEKTFSLDEWKQAQEQLESATTQMIMQTMSDLQLSVDILLAGGEI